MSLRAISVLERWFSRHQTLFFLTAQLKSLSKPQSAEAVGFEVECPCLSPVERLNLHMVGAVWAVGRLTAQLNKGCGPGDVAQRPATEWLCQQGDEGCFLEAAHFLKLLRGSAGSLAHGVVDELEHRIIDLRVLSAGHGSDIGIAR